MISEIESLETNEFLRRRKLRLQQVREQSKDVAKKLRERAKIEKLQQIVDVDSKSEKEYLRRQKEFVKHLEVLYTKRLQNVGASHKNALEKRKEDPPKKADLSKLRGKEAAAVIRKQKQEKIDKQKQLLDRKLQAREAANELSREKSSTVAIKLTVKTPHPPHTETDNDEKQEVVTNNNMATQWELDGIVNEWEPDIPSLQLPKDDRDSIKNTVHDKVESKSGNSNRLDLFAISDEMPSSLRGGLTNIHEIQPAEKPSVSIVSDYLQSRALNLRDNDVSKSAKKQIDDLQNVKQIIRQSRVSKPKAIIKDVIATKSGKSSEVDSASLKKQSVAMYNHATRDVRNVHTVEKDVVIHATKSGDDAYLQAIKESCHDNDMDKDHQNKIKDKRNKVAMTKQNVEKEYKDTIAFLNSLPKDNNTIPKSAFMDERLKQVYKDNRQMKLQQEYNKVEKETRRHVCKGASSHSNKKPKTPAKPHHSEDDNRDFQYSWMPVPESDGNLVVHTIPTSLKEGKSGNTVKFNEIDNYHEYRSRHKHTPPTKDHNNYGNRNKNEDTKESNNNESPETSISDSSSIGDSYRSDRGRNRISSKDLSDAEKIIIYKILNSKSDKRKKSKKVSHSTTMSSKENNINLKDQNKKSVVENIPNQSSELSEGIYKTVSEGGDNVTAMYFNRQNGNNVNLTRDEVTFGRSCTCGKQLKKDQQHSQGTATCNCNNQALDSKTTHVPTCTVCHCGCKTTEKRNASPTKHASTTSSVTSFKSATSDKGNFTKYIPEGDYVKLMNDDGKEAGKFYIGASGFLSDEGYEVIIQLKKKDSINGKTTDRETPVINKLAEKKLPIIDEISTNCDEATEMTTLVLKETAETEKYKNSNFVNIESGDQNKDELSNVLQTGDNPDNELQKSECQNTDKHTESETLNSVLSNKVCGVTDNKLINMSDKGVCTSFQMSYAVPDHFTKNESFQKPSSSAYTQTNSSPPNSRPVFVHMSSSTSTAYMSPPDIVLPNILCDRTRFRESKENTRDQKLKQDELFENMDQLQNSQKCCKGCLKCKCKQCFYARDNIIFNKKRKSNNSLNSSKTFSKHNYRKSNQSSTTQEIPIPKIHCHNVCRRKSNECNCCKKYLKTIANQTSHRKLKKSSSRNKYLYNITKSQSSKTEDPKYLDPIIKDYVHQLLKLNQNSIKAIEVMNEECSTVVTPGSSVINAPLNVGNKYSIENTISLEQIKRMLKEKIFKLCKNRMNFIKYSASKRNMSWDNSRHRQVGRMSTWKPVHKVKSINVAKRLFRNNKRYDSENIHSDEVTASIKNTFSNIKSTKFCKGKQSKSNVRSKSTPTPRTLENDNSQTEYESTNNIKTDDEIVTSVYNYQFTTDKITSVKTGSSVPKENQTSQFHTPVPISTQTTEGAEKEMHFMKLSQDKIQNMEKIADLTEKCTKRLSNLARVLEDVRKNKLAYGQKLSSDYTSDSDHTSDTCKSLNKDYINGSSNQSHMKENDNIDSDNMKKFQATSFIPFLTDIPKPNLSISTEPTQSSNETDTETSNTKIRGKPPPAMSRINGKYGQDNLIPHELSTVIEVDSPLSIRNKTRSTCNGNNVDSCQEIKATELENEHHSVNVSLNSKDDINIPYILKSNVDSSFLKNKKDADDCKVQMMDLQQFNEIMLKPFISVQEYAKQLNVKVSKNHTNLENSQRNEALLNDEMSSLHSDVSLPDVVAELLKRNIISEPFKFDTASNVNSTSVESSESAYSMLALSKTKKETKKSNVIFENKENLAETSETLSISSNPDLENAFKKLGMGWASSTLKKTKERLALSSSSNTSSSSLSQFKIKSFNKDVPALLSDSISSMINTPKKKQHKNNLTDNSKHAEQQTSLSNSMTVKEFLTKELAKKITFTNKSNKNDTEEFVSLYETKIPDEMKQASSIMREEIVNETMTSTNNNRARTSTPVQIFKSMTYHTSSSSNISNGLFSNVDDLSSVKITPNSIRNYSTSEKDDLTIPNYSLRLKKGSDCSKSD